ncbi:unnamed protein product [Acidocella sp. C78]|nr:unnamed protein product [Acidocella sp. C78]
MGEQQRLSDHREPGGEAEADGEREKAPCPCPPRSGGGRARGGAGWPKPRWAVWSNLSSHASAAASAPRAGGGRFTRGACSGIDMNQAASGKPRAEDEPRPRAGKFI